MTCSPSSSGWHASRSPVDHTLQDSIRFLEAIEAGNRLEADVALAERGWSGPARDPQAPLPLTGAPLVLVPGGDAPEPWPGKRDWRWWQALVRRTAVGGRDRIVLTALLLRAWTGPEDVARGRIPGQWTGYQREIQADIGDALGLRSIKRAVVGLMSRAIITRRYQGRRRAAGGGRGKSVYRILPSNPCERRDWT